jgi:hypothetical protein
MRLLVLAVTLLAACGAAPATPMLEFGDNTPDDLRALASETYQAVVEAFPAREDCLGRLVLSGAWELDDRAVYAPDRREITVRTPATAGQLEVSIVHEMAHHLEFSCPEQAELRPSFLTAQGFDPSADWFRGDSWETTPSEQWASAVVIHVLGRPDERAGVAVDARALDAVRDWANPS